MRCDIFMIQSMTRIILKMSDNIICRTSSSVLRDSKSGQWYMQLLWKAQGVLSIYYNVQSQCVWKGLVPHIHILMNVKTKQFWLSRDKGLKCVYCYHEIEVQEKLKIMEGERNLNQRNEQIFCVEMILWANSFFLLWVLGVKNMFLHWGHKNRKFVMKTNMSSTSPTTWHSMCR